jgi:hypothetical protein
MDGTKILEQEPIMIARAIDPSTLPAANDDIAPSSEVASQTMEADRFVEHSPVAMKTQEVCWKCLCCAQINTNTCS